MIRSRKIEANDVNKINLILKCRARRYVAAAQKEWLFPEKEIRCEWSELGRVLMPPKNELHHFGGEIYVGYEDGRTHYQDAYGRTVGDLSYLKKPERKEKVGANDECICGSGKKYKKCCRDKKSGEMPITNVRSIRERNLMFFNMLMNILGLSRGKTWEDIRAELSDKQVADIHKAFECLWPKGTNIIELLPMPDKRVSRVLYAGLIDPRTILQNVISYSLYFDEILVMNPFMNPTYIKPEYNPVESPAQYKQETLKNALLFMQLMPFIEKGIINLIPDPCSLNLQLQKQIWEMAQSRLKGLKLSDDQMAPMKDLCMDDIKRMMSGLPEESLRHNITKALPDLSEDDTEKVLEYMKQQRKADPLALLQPSVGKKGAGQILISHLTPNFELGFFLAQLTGAILYTDNQFRWEEILKVSNKGQCLWENLSKKMSAYEFTFEANSFICLEMRKAGKLRDLRQVLHKIFLSVGNETDQTKANQIISTLLSELDSSYNQAQKDWQWMDKQNIDSAQQSYRFLGKIRFNIPDQGFSVNTVNRLLLCYGRNNYLKSVLLAMNMKPTNN
ncbi:MAG: SEC-C domain-containing protein [Candidatus Omnitrophica bacterium]|nr:SEC-C domain-containing protein [Candidatus Omnitrophota bacterium]